MTMLKTIFLVFFVLSALILISESAPKSRKTKFQQNHRIKSGVGVPKCGYDACPSLPKDKLNVHLVAHTHDDVGWLKTVDQYYYGSKGIIQKAGVQYILDSVVNELLKDAEKRFIYVESAFFFRWYDEQTTDLQDKVKMLVEQGRLEFIGGAWSMNDEAASHYQSVIDQFTWGLHLLNETFGDCGRPKIGWQIDPFGHSSELASMLAQMDYDGLFLGRLDYEDKKWRLANQTMEMVWHNSANLKDSEIFTAGLYNIYAPPPGFCFDILCNDEPFIDDPLSSDYNVDAKIDDFVNYVKNMSASFKTNNVILTMGEDFHYQDANVWYKNLDKLIYYTNERRSNVNVFYSTPTCYLKALHDADLEWPSKTNDFFPYASDPHSYWTGYFTSRPTSKRFERVGNQFLQVCKQLTALAPKKMPDFDVNLDLLREAMGIMQHHDAITGTEKQHVADDYHYLLHKAIDSCAENTREALNQLFNAENKEICVSIMEKNSCEAMSDSLPKIPKLNFELCHHLNISMCEITERGTEFLVTVYNPKGYSAYEYIRLPVDGGSYTIKDANGELVSSQLVPIPDSIGNLNFRISSSLFELVFLADQIPAIGYKSYLVTKNVDVKLNPEEAFDKSPDIKIGNDILSVSFNENGLLDTITSNGVSSKLTQHFIYYESMIGNNREPVNRSSGAYIFRPDGNEKSLTRTVQLKVVKGMHVQEVHQIFNDWVSQVIRVYAKSNYVEFEWLVGPIPIEDGVGKEIVSRFDSLIENNGIFFTDSNGREMLKRKINFRDDWPLTIEESIAGNYYPITTKIAIESDKMRMAVLTDRAQGGTSIKDGTIDLMVHRRILVDDAFGVGEALNETAFGNGLIARGKHYLIFGHKKVENSTMKARERIIQSKIMHTGMIFLSDNVEKFNFFESTKKVNLGWSAAKTDLPENVNLMTFEPWSDGYTLIRFEHINEKDDDPIMSQAVKFDIRDVFNKFVLDDLKEMNLAANQLKTASKRLKFRSSSNANQKDVNKGENIYEVTLNPMEIKTFLVKMTYKTK